MSTQDPEFDMEAFNRLPTEDVFDIENANLEQLKRAFPYILKPNAAIALFHKQEDGHDAGHPLKDARSNTLIKINLTAHLLNKKTPIVSINRSGQFFLWEYRNTQDVTTSGVFPLYLLPDNQPDNLYQHYQNSFSLLEEIEPSSEYPTGNLYEFDLVAAFQSCDSEGVVILRLLSPFTEHVIKLDFGAVNIKSHRIPHKVINSSRTQFYKTNRFRQIGGWDGSTPLYWGELATEWEHSGRLIIGSIRNPSQIIEVQQKNFRSRIRGAALEQTGLILAGGDEEELWKITSHNKNVYYNVQSHKNLDKNKILKGYIRCIAIIPIKNNEGRKNFLVMVGSDDHQIYVLDDKGNKLQQVNMKGIVESILCLNPNEEKEYADFVVTVRNQGIYCFRIFYMKLNIEQQYKYRLINAFCDKQSFDISKLQIFFSDKSQLSKLIAITASVENLASCNTMQINDIVKAFKQHSADWDRQIANYVVYLLNKQIQQVVNSDGETNEALLRSYLELLLSLVEQPLHNPVVRNLEGWLKLLRHKYKNQWQTDTRNLIDKITKELPNKKETLKKWADSVYELCKNNKTASLEQFQETISNLLTVKLVFSSKLQRLFNEVVVVPATEGAHIDAVTMIDFGREINNLTYVLRGDFQLHSFRVISQQQDFYNGYYNHQFDEFDKSTNIQPTIRALVPLINQESEKDKNNSIALVVTNRRLAIAKKGEQKVHYFHWTPLSYWASVAFHNDKTHKIRVVVAGEWRSKSQNIDYQIDENSIINCFEFDKENLSSSNLNLDNASISGTYNIISKIFKPPLFKQSGWEKSLHFRDLFWDKQGNLWGATSGEGHILRWKNAATASEGEAIRAEIITIVGSPLYAIWVDDEDKLLFCGGYDGVLRAFDIQNLPAVKLEWVSPLPGAIRAITARSSRLIKGKNNFSDLAVITEAGYLVLYNHNGTIEGTIHIEQPLVSMFSGILREEGAQHHLVGTLNGEVRLIEEIAKEPNSNTHSWKTAFCKYLMPREIKKIEKEKKAELQKLDNFLEKILMKTSINSGIQL